MNQIYQCQTHKEILVGYNIENSDIVRPICSRCIPSLSKGYFGEQRYLNFEQATQLLDQLKQAGLSQYKSEILDQFQQTINQLYTQLKLLYNQISVVFDLIIQSDPQQEVLDSKDPKQIAQVLHENCQYDIHQQKYKIKSQNAIHIRFNKIISKSQHHMNECFESINQQLNSLKKEEIELSQQTNNHKNNYKSYKELFKLNTKVQQVKSLAYHDKYKQLFCVDQDIKILQFDLKTKQLIQEYSAHYDKISALLIVNDTLISTAIDKSLIIWNIIIGGKAEVKKQITIKSTILQLIKYKNSFASINSDKVLAFWNDTTCVNELKNKVEITSIDCNQDYSQIAIGQIDGIIRIRKEKFNIKIESHFDCVKALKFINESYLVSGGWDKQIKIWMELKNGDYSCIQTIYDHNSYINFIEQVGGYLISSDDDKIIKIWQQDRQWKEVSQIGRYPLVTAMHVYQRICFLGFDDSSIQVLQFN
ncbi:unnamed protein product [Paramecium pentaurelia]|uniref:Uncharacterized protein n=1 Tax=Paramecium pentaurelia TaxID=43138 RepID=A0A8S1TVI2_9CILI|nr:unnamed protein product [Paramecium pentaurelia]